MFLLAELKELGGEIYYYVGCTIIIENNLHTFGRSIVIYYKLKN